MRWMRAGLILSVLLSVTSCSAKDETPTVFTAPLGSYGEAYTYPAGSSLTDGNTILELTDGPVRVLSISFQEDGQKAVVLGTRIRALSETAIPFDSVPGFTADSATLAGSVVADGAMLSGPATGRPFAAYEVIVGYQMPSGGRYVRTGMTITYEYKHQVLTQFHPSWIALCVGASNQTPCLSSQ